MIVASAQLNIGLLATAANTRTNTTGLNSIGLPNTTFDFSGIAKAYSFEVTVGSSVNFRFDTHAFTAVPYSAGTKQVETATGAGTVTTAGDVTVVITSAPYGNSTLNITLALGDTPALWLPKIRTALAASTGSASNFTWTNTASTLVAVSKFASDNDSALNISIANGTCAGITNAPTSTNTTSGVAASGGLLTNGPIVDFEGRAITSSTKLSAVLIQCISGKLIFLGSFGEILQSSTGGFALIAVGSLGSAVNINDDYYFAAAAGYQGSVVRVTAFES